MVPVCAGEGQVNAAEPRLCHFCKDKPRENPYWVELGADSGVYICGLQHHQDPVEDAEINRITDYFMQLYLDGLCAEHGVGTIQQLRNLLNEGRPLGHRIDCGCHYCGRN